MRKRRILVSLCAAFVLPIVGASSARAAGTSVSGVQFSVPTQQAGTVSAELYAFDNEAPYDTPPTGTITVRQGSTTLGTFDAYHEQGGPIGTLTAIADRPAGTYTWTAEYSGDDVYAPSTSTVTFTLYKRAVDVTVFTADKGMSQYDCGPGAESSCDKTPNVDQGDPITFTAWITPHIPAPQPYPSTTPATVTFLDNGTPIGSAPLTDDGSVKWTTSTLPPGDHSIQVRYNGNSYYEQLTDPDHWYVTIVPGQRDLDIARIAGDDRIATAIATSQDSFDDGGAGAVVLTTGNQFADALGGTPLAIGTDAPVLLTPSGAPLDPRTRAEIDRVLPSPGTVYVLGGERAVGSSVDDELRSAGYDVVRVAGANRFETAVAIAESRTEDPTAILLADGMTFPDALAGGAAAGHLDGVVLLTDGSTMPASTRGYLDAHPSVPVYALGGRAAAADPAATAVAGRDRYETSYLVAKQFFDHPTFVGVASGESFADALGGGAEAGGFDGPLLLATWDSLGGYGIQYVTDEHDAITVGRVFGGTSVLSAAVLGDLQGTLQ